MRVMSDVGVDSLGGPSAATATTAATTGATTATTGTAGGTTATADANKDAIKPVVCKKREGGVRRGRRREGKDRVG